MKRALWLILALFPALAFGQNSRYDFFVSTTTGQGQEIPILALPFAQISFYACTSGSSCGTLANTYPSSSSASPCPSGQQVTLQGSGACGTLADSQGNFCAWLSTSGCATSPCLYAWTAVIRGRSYGPYVFSLGGGGGTPFSLNTLTGAVTLAVGSGLSITPSGNTLTINLTTPFTINSFSGCSGTVELGTTITNPAYTATYSATPASANITNTDGIDSPLTLNTPFTSGTVIGSFVHTGIATTTFTLTAIGSSTQTASCTDTWQPAIFGGVGTPGATSSVTASGTTAVLSTSDALPRAQLGAETVGENFGPYMPSAQSVYLLLLGNSHTFTDALTGFPFAFNAPTTVTFVNAHGVTITMYLYESTNPLFVTVGNQRWHRETIQAPPPRTADGSPCAGPEPPSAHHRQHRIWRPVPHPLPAHVPDDERCERNPCLSIHDCKLTKSNQFGITYSDSKRHWAHWIGILYLCRECHDWRTGYPDHWHVRHRHHHRERGSGACLE